MKKITKSLFLVAASAFILASCQIELVDPNEAKEPIQDDNIVLLTINTGAPQTDVETKTYISGETSSSASPSWANGDKVTVVYTNTSAEVVTAQSSALNENGSSASFTVALTAPDNTVDAYAYFPNNAKDATSSTATLVIDKDQLPTGTSFDGASDIMISKSFTPAGSVNTQFRRLGAFLKIKVSHASINSEKLVSLSVTSDNYLAGDVEVNLADGTISDISNGSKTVTATYDDANQFTVSADGKYVYLIVYPQTLAKDSHLIISGATKAHTFSKDISLPSDIVLKSGHIQPLNITITDTPSAVDYVTLDWNWAGGTKSQLTANAGVSQSGLGDDYAAGNAPYRCKFDTNGDYVQIKTNTALSSLSFGYKCFTASGTVKVTVEESSDGSSYTTAGTLSVTGLAQNATGTLSSSFSFKSTTRFIRLKRASGSSAFGMGPITISKSDSRTATGIEWKKSGSTATTDVATLATGQDTMPTIELDNPNNLPVFFSSSNTSVATVIPSTSESSVSGGAVVSLVGAGSTDIVVSFAGNKDYQPASVKYTLTVTDSRTKADAPTFNKIAGEYTVGTEVAISGPAGSTIYYTTNGDTPTHESSVYSSAIVLSDDITLKAIAAIDDYKDSDVASAAYTVPVVATPSISITSNTVTITCGTAGATIYYTIDGTTPSTGSTPYSGSFAVAAGATIKAIAAKDGCKNSAVAVKNNVESTTITVSIATYASANSWENGTQYDEVILDSSITATAAGSDNTGKYYTADNSWRFYAVESGTLTIEASGSHKITSITLSFTTKDNGTMSYGGSTLSTDDEISISSLSSVTFETGSSSGSKGKVFITAISVTYE